MNPRPYFVVLAAAVVAQALSASGMPPARYSYQGRLTDNAGIPLEGSHLLYFSLYSGGSAEVAGSGDLLYQESAMADVQQGIVNHAVGSGAASSGEPLDHRTLRGASDTYLQVAVNTESNVVLPRVRLESVPYASMAANGEARIPLDGPLPITLSKPGSYYLTRNLKQTNPNRSGVIITTSSVTLDLNGFVLTGPGRESSGSTYGITVVGASPVENVTIRNGVVEEWSRWGVHIASRLYLRNRVQNITALRNGFGNSTGGIAADGLVDIEGCKAFHNGSFGIYCRSGIIRSCFASRNGYDGITLSGGTIRDCISSENGADGFQIHASSMSDCLSTGNSEKGVSAANHCILKQVVCYGNGTAGIYTFRDCLVSECSASSNTLEGIVAGDTCIVERCLVRENDGAGISVTNRCTVSGCSVSQNSGGILVSNGVGTVVEGNTVSINFGDEISVSSGVRVVGNRVSGSVAASGSGSGYGIRAQSECHIEDNTVSRNAIGIRTEGACLVIGNKASGNNTNYSLSSGANGPVVSSAGVATNTNPSANYSY